jgi:hypothetical protein
MSFETCWQTEIRRTTPDSFKEAIILDVTEPSSQEGENALSLNKNIALHILGF